MGRRRAASPATGRRRRAQRWLKPGHLVRVSGPAGGHGDEVLAAKDLPQQELREHARLQRELAAVGGQGFDLAHDLPGHVAADDAPACPRGPGHRRRVRRCGGRGAGQPGSPAPAGELGRRCRGQDQAGEAGGGDHVGAAVPVSEELSHAEPAGLLAAAAVALLPHLRFTGQDQEQLGGRLALLYHARPRRVPADLDVVADVTQGAGRLGQQQESVGKGGRPGKAARPTGQPGRQPLHDQQVARREVPVVQPGRPGGRPVRAVPGAARPLAGGRGRRADGDVVGMAVAAVGTERDDDVGPEFADDLRHLVHQGGEPGVGEGAVDVVQAAHRRDAEALAGQAQLGLPDSGDGPPVTGGSVADLARLAAGRRHHHDLGTLPGVAGERAPGAERLVVRMGEDTQQAAAASRRHAVIEQARPRGARPARARPVRRRLPGRALRPGAARHPVKRPDEGCRMRAPVQLGHLAVRGEPGDTLAGTDRAGDGPVRCDAAA